MSDHPSQYALDRGVLGAPLAADVAAHVAACSRCREIVAARRSPPAMPAWAKEIRVRPASAPIPLPRWRRGWSFLPLSAVFAAAVVLALVYRPQRALLLGAEITRPKGAPAVTLYVKRGEQVTVWDGRASLRPGDRLRLGVRGVGYAQLSVASLSSPDEPPALLYAGPLEREGETLLPLSFRVDERAGTEVLSVILSEQSVAASAHADPPQRARERGAWTTRLELPKEVDR